MTYFRIQISNPKINMYKNLDNETLSEALQDLYKMETEDAFIHLNGFRIPLNYKYDISIISEDIISMIKKIFKKKEGVYSINWSSDTFYTLWNLNWKNNKIDFNVKWYNISGHLETLLNQNLATFSINKMEFIYEWNTLLKFLSNSLSEVGYKKDDLFMFKDLINLTQTIEKSGYFYR